MPACSHANSVPVRPNPVAISSAISSTSCSSHRARTAGEVVGRRRSASRRRPARSARGSPRRPRRRGPRQQRAASRRGGRRSNGGPEHRRAVGARRAAGPARRRTWWCMPLTGSQTAIVAERVAVVAAADGQEAVPVGSPDPQPVLDRHLDGDLDRDRAGVGEEDAGQAVGGDVDQPRGPDRPRPMGEPAEHHVGHLLELPGHGAVERPDGRSRGSPTTTTPCRRSARARRPASAAPRSPVRRGGCGAPTGAGGVGMPHLGLIELDEIVVRGPVVHSPHPCTRPGRDATRLADRWGVHRELELRSG